MSTSKPEKFDSRSLVRGKDKSNNDKSSNSNNGNVTMVVESPKDDKESVKMVTDNSENEILEHNKKLPNSKNLNVELVVNPPIDQSDGAALNGNPGQRHRYTMMTLNRSASPTMKYFHSK